MQMPVAQSEHAQFACAQNWSFICLGFIGFCLALIQEKHMRLQEEASKLPTSNFMTSYFQLSASYVLLPTS